MVLAATKVVDDEPEVATQQRKGIDGHFYELYEQNKQTHYK